MEEKDLKKDEDLKNEETGETQEAEGKNLAKNEEVKENEEKEQVNKKSKLEEEILKETAGINLGNTVELMNNLSLVGLGDGQAKLMYGDVTLAVVQNGEIQYTSYANEDMRKKLNEEFEQNQKQEQLKKEQEKDTGEREEEKDEETIYDDNEETIEEEEPEQEPELEDGEVPEPEKDIKRDSSWIEIRSDRETDECRTFMGMIKKEYPEYVKGTERLFFAPNPKDSNDYNLYVMGKNGKITGEIPLNQTEGRNPTEEDVLQYGKDGSNAKTKQPIQMLKIGNSPNSPMVMIYNGTRTDTQIHIGSRSEGDNYQSHAISSSRSQNDIQDATESVKSNTSSNLAERTEGDRENEKYYQTLTKLQKQNVPDEINPAKDQNKITDIEVENFDELRENFAKVLMEEYPLTKEAAAYVAVEVLENGRSFNETLDEAQGVLETERQKEQDGRIPPGSAERSAAAYFEDRITSENEQVYEEEQEYTRGDPRQH